MQSSERGKLKKFSGSWYNLGYDLYQPPGWLNNLPQILWSSICSEIYMVYGVDSPAVKYILNVKKNL